MLSGKWQPCSNSNGGCLSRCIVSGDDLFVLECVIVQVISWSGAWVWKTIILQCYYTVGWII